MAIPFALALALTVGSYLLLHATLFSGFSLATQCVESAAPSRAFFDDLTMMTVTVTTAVRHPSRSMKRRQWDPGILPFAHPHDGLPMPSPPACRLSAAVENSSGNSFYSCRRPTTSELPSLPSASSPLLLIAPSHSNVVVVTMVRTNRLILEPSCRLLRSGCFDFRLINNTVSLVESPPGIASSVSVFHYCHPVLSRPTVPNIDT